MSTQSKYPLTKKESITDSTLSNYYLPGDEVSDEMGAVSSLDRLNRKDAHVVSEKRRRDTINRGFERLKMLVPTCRESNDSKAIILDKAALYIEFLQQELDQMRHGSTRHYQPSDVNRSMDSYSRRS